jgi:hypothetical protein
MSGGEEGCIQGFSREGDHLEDLSLDGKMILKWFLNKLAFVKEVVNLCVP